MSKKILSILLAFAMLLSMLAMVACTNVGNQGNQGNQGNNGNGTDGKAFTIYKEKYDGSRETSVMKILRLGENRNERKTFNLDGAREDELQEGFDKIIAKIIKNIETVKKADNGKFFIKYEDLELRNASDGKGRLILINLEFRIYFSLEALFSLVFNVCNRSVCSN